MIDLAFKRHQEVLSIFSDQPYSCLALDAGTTFGKQYLHFVLENPLAKLPAFFADLVFSKDQKQIRIASSLCTSYCSWPLFFKCTKS